MYLMAHYTKEALGEKANIIEDETIAELGLANTFFWTAFVIYDDFWDLDEEANPQVLPTANFYARSYVNTFTSLLPSSNFNSLFTDLIDKLDSANTWETVYCRTEVKNNIFQIPENLPEYGNYDLKYQPASGHILGSVAIFYMLGYTDESEETRNLISYFKNYLITMQLNDDAHDWEEDLNRGHLSTVVVMLIQDWLEKHPNSKEIDLEKDLDELKEIFWFKTLSRACETAIEYTKKSKEALDSINILENKAPLEHYTIITRNVAEEALREQKKTLDILKEFKN
jgi:hypothetical protein